MKRQLLRWGLVTSLVAMSLILIVVCVGSRAQETPGGRLVAGVVRDPQGQPVQGANLTLSSAGQPEPVAEATTQANGGYALPISGTVPSTLTLQVSRPHFEQKTIDLDSKQISQLQAGDSVVLPEITLARRITAAFWVATAIFVAMLVLIATGTLHNTLAALLGASLVFAVSYLGSPLVPDLFIFQFSNGLAYVDWNVIFLIMGMMIIIAVVERTGIFQWLALMAYRLSGGRPWLLLAILMFITSVASALLDNVTTMLLMTPITIQIALAIGINPLALLLPELMTSNVAGISTLIGTPTNILIGSFASISFNDFLINQTPGVLLAIAGIMIYSLVIYRKQLLPPEASDVPAQLMEKLVERAHITEPSHLRKAAWIGAGMLVLFVLGENIHLLPGVTALMGATALLVWIRPDIEEMIEAVDWTTLVFFITLFVVVGAVQEVGLISLIATAIGNVVKQNLILAMLVVTWASALLSMVIANIPFTAAMLPVVGFLTASIPAANSKVLFYCLSVGSAMGGNGSLIGASANMVTAGIAERAGHPMSYVFFLRKGLPALFISVSLATVWLLLRFLVLGG
ncbi:MAG: SLC13 family permease [Anaerolineae bacterium]|jgi:Na+/H+ antiporter NhaD/arsenite permease-like protein